MILIAIIMINDANGVYITSFFGHLVMLIKVVKTRLQTSVHLHGYRTRNFFVYLSPHGHRSAAGQARLRSGAASFETHRFALV